MLASFGLQIKSFLFSKIIGSHLKELKFYFSLVSCPSLIRRLMLLHPIDSGLDSTTTNFNSNFNLGHRFDGKSRKLNAHRCALESVHFSRKLLSITEAKQQASSSFASNHHYNWTEVNPLLLLLHLSERHSIICLPFEGGRFFSP